MSSDPSLPGTGADEKALSKNPYMLCGSVESNGLKKRMEKFGSARSGSEFDRTGGQSTAPLASIQNQTSGGTKRRRAIARKYCSSLCRGKCRPYFSRFLPTIIDQFNARNIEKYQSRKKIPLLFFPGWSEESANSRPRCNIKDPSRFLPRLLRTLRLTIHDNNHCWMGS